MNALSCNAALACIAFVGAAQASVLYKSVSPAGVVEFSDTHPQGREAVERLALTEGATPRRDDESWRKLDEAVLRANQQLDLAEHALALARNSSSSPPDPLRFGERRLTPAENERVASCRKNLLNARRVLLDVVARQRRAEAATYVALK